jgi:D-alanyl-D-alanine dipeptidase
MQTRLGIWRDAWFGEVSLCASRGAVRFVSAKSPLLAGTVMEVGPRLLVDWDADSVDAQAWLDFGDAATAPPGQLHLAKVDPGADFSYDYEDLSFTRVRDCAASPDNGGDRNGEAPAASGRSTAAEAISPARTAAAAGLVDVASLVPDIALDLRYAGEDNFVGRPIDGYQAAHCLLLETAARALARVETRLRKQHLRLRLFDCYRPARAVADFVRWAADPEDRRTKARYYPHLDKGELLGDYIAPVSGHSRGATVDLTVLRCSDGRGCEPLDMGTGFDYFDPLAHTDAEEIGAAQRANRRLLREAMEREGFRNYPREWWHYTLAPGPDPRPLLDVPIR